MRSVWQPGYGCELDVVSNDDLGNGEAAGVRWMLTVGGVTGRQRWGVGKRWIDKRAVGSSAVKGGVGGEPLLFQSTSWSGRWASC